MPVMVFTMYIYILLVNEHLHWEKSNQNSNELWYASQLWSRMRFKLLTLLHDQLHVTKTQLKMDSQRSAIYTWQDSASMFVSFFMFIYVHREHQRTLTFSWHLTPFQIQLKYKFEPVEKRNRNKLDHAVLMGKTSVDNYVQKLLRTRTNTRD